MDICFPKQKQEESITKKLMREIYDRAVNLKADAVIHYTTQIFQNREGVYEGSVRGTFLKKREIN